MKHIFRTAMALSAGVILTASCEKEFEYVFADEGPEVKVNSFSESAYMGGEIAFSADIRDDDFALSTLKVQLYFDQDMVGETTIRTKENGTYEGKIAVPFMADIPDGTAQLVFVGQNVGQAVTRATADVKVSRPVFDFLTLVVGEEEFRMEKTDEDYVYSVQDDFEPQCNAIIRSPEIPGTDRVLEFGWEGGAVALDSDTEIPFSNLTAGYAISFNTLTFEASPFIIVSVNDVEADMSGTDGYEVTLELEQGEKVTVEGLGDLSQWYFDPDYFNTGGNNADVTFNAMSGNYKISMNTADRYFVVTRLKSDGTEATVKDGALWLMGWGVAHPVMTSQFGFNEKEAFCMAEVKENVYQFTGIAVEEKDGTTIGGRFRNNYVSAKYYGQNAWGDECGKIFGTATEVKLSGNAAGYVKLTDSYNVELADAENKSLELGATYRLTVDLTKAESEGIETISFDRL